ncbi:MAG TPA: RodZ domain-containing protein [Woeseiaceae bacterium]|nr:RodZ domain-containing protein [Woeseiaceae bacterium]
MVHDADDPRQQAAVEPRAGQRLANARRANNISMRDIAKELHLDEVKVQALEDNRFEVLGAPVFAKGYLRKYAELVNVPMDDVLADYYRLNRAVGAPPVVGPKRERPPRELFSVSWIAGALVLVAAAAGTWWWLDRPAAPGESSLPSGTAEPQRTEPTSAPSAQPAGNGAVTVLPPDPGSGDTGVETGTAEAESTAAEVPADELPAASDPVEASASVPANVAELQLQLSFRGDCWTEVTDGNGSRLFFGLGTDGRTVIVSGIPPLRVLLGNNDNVSLLVNGKEYTVQASELRGNTARLTIVAP